MANPYFNATYYLQQNPDLFAAGINDDEAAWAHYSNFGAGEAIRGFTSRNPAPWFDGQYYFQQNPDLALAGLTSVQIFEHFVNHGIAEGRAPSAAADEAVTAESLTAYANANEDLRIAFGIEDGEAPTEAQLTQLAQHFYQFGYNEEREGLPMEFSGNPGQTFTITANQDDYLGTDGDDVFNAATDRLDSSKVIDGAAGNDTVNAQYSDGAVFDLTLLNVENLNVTARGALNLDLEEAADLENISVTRGSATAAIVLDSIGEDAVVSLNDLEAASVALNYFGSLEDVDFALNVNNADVGALTVTGDGTTLADAASVTFNVQGDNEVDLAVAQAADLEGQTVVVTGAGDLLLGGLSDDSFGTTAADRVKLDATALEGTFGVEVAGGTTYDLRDAAGLGAFIIADDAGDTVVQRLSSDTIVGVDEAEVDSLALDLATGNTAATLALNGDSTVGSLTSSVPARLVELSISVDGETGETAVIEAIDLAETESLSISVEEDASLEIGEGTFDDGAGLEGLTSLEVAGDGDVTADLTEAVELAVIDLSEHTGVATLNLRADEDGEDLLVTFGEGDATITLVDAANPSTPLENAYTFVFAGEEVGTVVIDFGGNVEITAALAEDITLDFSALGIDEDDIDFVDDGTDTVITIGDGSITLTGLTGLTLDDFNVVL